MLDTPLDRIGPGDLEPDERVCDIALQELVMVRESTSAALLATRDGRPFMFKARDKAERHPARMAAMISSLAGLSQSVLKETSQDGLDMILLEGGKSKFLIVRVPAGGGYLVLAVQAKEGANLGRLLNDTRACVAKVSASFKLRKDS